MSETDWSFCWSHHRRERITEDTYRVCGECGHVYPEPADLVAVPADQMPLIRPRPDPGEILVCLECVHDF